jgi:hypothetical protein
MHLKKVVSMIAITNKLLSKIFLRGIWDSMYLVNELELERLVTLFRSVMICRYSNIEPLLRGYGIVNAISRERRDVIDDLKSRSSNSLESFELVNEYRSTILTFSSMSSEDKNNIWVLIPTLLTRDGFSILNKNRKTDDFILHNPRYDRHQGHTTYELWRYLDKEKLVMLGQVKSESPSLLNTGHVFRLKKRDYHAVIADWEMAAGISIEYGASMHHFLAKSNNADTRELVRCEDVTFIVNSMDGEYASISPCEVCPHGIKRLDTRCTFFSNICDVRHHDKGGLSWSKIAKKISKY